MDFNRWCIRSQTTLNGSITNTATSLVVTDASSFPSQPYFYILIDNELIYVTAVSGTTFTIQRGKDGTTGAAHTTGANIYGVLTGGNLDNRLSNIIQRGSVSVVSSGFNSESTGAGRLYSSSDCPISYYDLGGSFEALETSDKIYCFDATLNWLNQGSSTYNVGNDGVTNKNLAYLTAVNSGSLGDNIHGIWRSNTTTGKLITRLLPYLTGIYSDYYEYGAFVYDSTSGNFITMTVRVGDTIPLVIRGDKWTNATTYASNYFIQTVFADQIKYIGIEDDGTDINFYIGPDPSNMIKIFSVSRTDFTASISKIGIFGNPRPASSTLKIFDYYNVRS